MEEFLPLYLFAVEERGRYPLRGSADPRLLRQAYPTASGKGRQLPDGVAGRDLDPPAFPSRFRDDPQRRYRLCLSFCGGGLAGAGYRRYQLYQSGRGAGLGPDEGDRGAEGDRWEQEAADQFIPYRIGILYPVICNDSRSPRLDGVAGL